MTVLVACTASLRIPPSGRHQLRSHAHNRHVAEVDVPGLDMVLSPKNQEEVASSIAKIIDSHMVSEGRLVPR